MNSKGRILDFAPFFKADHGNFLRSNCRIFFASSSPVSSMNFKSNQHTIDWNSVQAVDMISTYGSIPCCPICLEEDFVAPHITRCGHVFCLPCYFRYYNSEATKGSICKKCPVCSMPTVKDDLRLARFQLVEPPTNFKTISFCLVERRYDLTSISPSKPFLSDLHKNFPQFCSPSPLSLPNEDSIGIQFARFGVFKRPDLLWEQDIQSLINVLEEFEIDQDNDAVDATAQAIEFLHKRAENYSKTKFKYKSDKSSNKYDNYYCARNVADYDLMGFLHISKSFIDNFNNKTWDIEQNPSEYSFEENVTKDMAKCYTTYQTIDGQLCFLHPLQLRCLEYEHKQTNNIPPLLFDLKIIDHNTYLLNEKIVKRHKFLGHLPMLTPITFIEADIDHLLSEKTKFHFQDIFEVRQNHKMALKEKSAQREQTYHQKIERQEREKMNSVMWIQHETIKYEDHLSFPALNGKIESNQIPDDTETSSSRYYPQSSNSYINQNDGTDISSSPSYLDILTHSKFFEKTDKDEDSPNFIAFGKNSMSSTISINSAIHPKDKFSPKSLPAISIGNNISISNEEFQRNHAHNELISLSQKFNFKIKTKNKKKRKT